MLLEGKSSDMFFRMIVRKYAVSDGCACYSGAIERCKRIVDVLAFGFRAHGHSMANESETSPVE